MAFDEPSLGVVARWAAHLGRALVPLTDDQRDRLDVLAELGGEATVAEIIKHCGGGRVQNVHLRLMTMVRLGAVERKGDGTHGAPYLYALTPVGRVLQVNA